MPQKHAFLRGLNEEQQKAIEPDGISLVFAGAGSGKTRTLIYKLANVLLSGFKPYKIIALTFTNKAAQEMKERALRLIREITSVKSELSIASNLFVGTFHSWGAKFLRQETSPTLTIYDEEDAKKLLKEILRNLNEDLEPDYIKETISFAKNRLIDISEFIESSQNFERKIAEIWKIYDRKLRELNGFDFDDLILCPLQMLSKNQRLKEKYQYQYVLVDEFQDTNLPQYLLVKLLTEKHKNLFCCGDDYQAIYGWRGSNYKNILQLENDFNQINAFILGRNYRSTKKIIASANHLILNNKFQKHKKLWTKNKTGENLNIYEAYNEDEEAEIITGLINDFIATDNSQKIKLNAEIPSASGRGNFGVKHFKKNNSHMDAPQFAAGSFTDIAVLYRVNFLSRSIEEKLLTKKIPYKIYGGVHFYQRKEIKDIIAYLRILDNPRDLISLKRIINLPTRGIGSQTQAKFFNLGAEKIAQILSNQESIKEIDAFIKIYFYLKQLMDENPPFSEFLKHLIETTKYLEYLREAYNSPKFNQSETDRILNISELINVASKFDVFDFKEALREFLNLSSLWQAYDEVNQGDKIKLMTIHLAKGLEFKNVFIIGMEEGIFPHHKSITSDLFANNNDLEEERRLAYVAITRAKEKVFISYTQRRKYWGRFVNAKPSRFINELPAAYVNFYRF
jgi:DNA helicase-2/ATP-dependent DNA helicase PcrA